MIFNSLDFGFFLPIVFIIYWGGLRNNIHQQNIFLLIASYLFYGWWDWRFLFLIFFSTLVDFFVGLKLDNEDKPFHRNLLLATSLFTNLGILGFFKYYNFFLDNAIVAFQFLGFPIQLTHLDIILPVGISFYTFQTLSYTIDIYNRKLKPTRNFIAFSAFVSFFPQLVAGPIERASHLLPQFSVKRSLNPPLFVSGLEKILWGLVKKVVIADRLALFVNEVYAYPEEYKGFVLVLATLFFAFQIYCDFSGYSDIAIGTAALFGFDLVENFRSPYFSKSLTEFWRRWHISLSTWFRDYVYIPLGGNQTSKSRWRMNIMIVFIVSGLWHGASWNFIIWGAIHGLVLILESLFKNPLQKRKMNLQLRGVATFMVVCLGWVFFRAQSLEDAFYIVGHIFELSDYSFQQLSLNMIPLNKDAVYPFDLFISLTLVLFLVSVEFMFANNPRYRELQFVYKMPLYLIGIWSIYMLGIFENNAFIYFQF